MANVRSDKRISTAPSPASESPVVPNSEQRPPYRAAAKTGRARQSSPSDASAGTVVLQWARDDSRAREIGQACLACDACLQRIDAKSRIAHDVDFRACAAAIVELSEPGADDDSGYSVVAELKAAGLGVIAHAAGVGRWPIATRCQVLLAGARYLLDNSDKAFGDVLSSTLRDLLGTLAEQRSEEGRIRGLARAHGIVGTSDSLLDAFRSVVRMSRLSDLPVLITGESGTGKELFANALHALDPKRSGRPMVAVNCAAISSGIAESELFGHVRGAFTGAGRDHSGFFLAAQGGVLFLDEIGELDLDVQAKILRVLQERRLYRVGSGYDAAIDIRIVAATNQDLPKRVEQGRFRADLFHRLNTLSIHISPLRERRSDLPLLVEHFVRSHASWREYTGIDTDLLDALACLELKGNVRELRNLITTAQAGKSDRRPLSLTDLPSQTWKELAQSGFMLAPPRTAEPEPTIRPQVGAAPERDSHSLALTIATERGFNLSHCLDECECAIVAAAMRRAHNNQSQAARMLGLTPRSIYNKLRKHHLLRKPPP